MTDTLYYVYMKWNPSNDGSDDSALGRHLVTFKSRQDADEFFRFCLTVTTPGTNLPSFQFITRANPQFWLYNNNAASTGISAYSHYFRP
jgi:hypothetical protein